ncbi:hypothetical protein [Brevundimonas diminuta]|uniref:hypothetical protein n=1 Tax=Brevundimonas diminuta TaxID=293 RepID=UPI003F809475
MRAIEALIAWTPNRYPFLDEATCGQVRVGPLLGEHESDWTKPYAKTGGACFSERHEMNEWQLIAMTFIDFHTLVVRDGISPQDAHEAFLAIDEYRQRMSPDIPGSEDA